MKLNDLKIGDDGRIGSLTLCDSIKKRLLDIGFSRGVLVKPILENKSMRAYLIKGTIIALRKEDTSLIEVSL